MWLRTKALMRSEPRRSLDADAPYVGMRRMGWVRIEIQADGPRCTVFGVSHRLPVERSVPLGIALALWRSGVPTVIRRRGGSHAVLSPELAGSG